LILQFDPRSQFPYYSDQLQIFLAKDRRKPVGTPIYRTCPKEKFFIPGNYVSFFFNPSSYQGNSTGWGYECQGNLPFFFFFFLKKKKNKKKLS